MPQSSSLNSTSTIIHLVGDLLSILDEWRIHLPIALLPLPDFQMLRITLASVKYSDNWQKLSFVDKDAALLRPNVTHALFRLSETSSGADTQYYKHLKDSYTTLHASVVIERQVTNFVFKLILPIWLIVITSSLGYWVNPKVAPARVGLAIVCVLTQISFSSSISKMLPAIAYLTWLDYFQFVRHLVNMRWSPEMLCSDPSLTTSPIFSFFSGCSAHKLLCHADLLHRVRRHPGWEVGGWAAACVG